MRSGELVASPSSFGRRSQLLGLLPSAAPSARLELCPRCGRTGAPAWRRANTQQRPGEGMPSEPLGRANKQRRAEGQAAHARYHWARFLPSLPVRPRRRLIMVWARLAGARAQPDGVDRAPCGAPASGARRPATREAHKRIAAGGANVFAEREDPIIWPTSGRRASSCHRRALCKSRISGKCRLANILCLAKVGCRRAARQLWPSGSTWLQAS